MNQLETYILGKFPIICTDTHEVDRAIAKISGELDRINKNIEKYEIDNEYISCYGYTYNIWYPTTGIKNNANEKVAEATDFEGFLDLLVNSKDLVAGIYIVPNVHLYLEETQMYLINSFLIQHYHNFNNRYLVLIGNTSKLPEEVLIKTVSLDFNLPNVKEIYEHLKVYVKDLGFNFKQEILKKASEASSGMSLQEIENAVKVSLVSTNGKKLDCDILHKEKAKVVKRTGLLEVIDTNENMETLGGMNELKDWMKGVQKIFKYPQKAKDFGLDTPKGTLVTGISGCGKTLFAKAIANYLDVPLFRCDVGRIFGGIVGETERNTRELWKLIESVHPCVILIDEIEKVMSGMGSSNQTDGGVTSRFIGTMLYHLEEKKVPAFFVATANNISSLPPELLRKGRWDEIWFVDIPTEEERKEILKIHLSKVKRNPDKYINKELLVATENFTGAELEQIVHSALRIAFVEDRECTSKDLLQCAKATNQLVVMKKEEIEALRKWADNRARRATTIKPEKQINKRIVNRRN